MDRSDNDGFPAKGCQVLRGLAAPEDVSDLAQSVDRLARAKGGGANRRDLLDEVPEIERFIRGDALRCAVERLLGREAFAVKVLWFDKTPDSNWGVGWHQDQVIAVRRRVETPGFGPWSTKNGTPHVRPPAAVLERMLTLRLSLDPCGPDNGPLRVVPGSHLDGLLAEEVVRDRVVAPVDCCLEAGDAIAMRPLLLHASSKAAKPSRRRVLHVEFASGDLPGRLEWPRRIA